MFSIYADNHLFSMRRLHRILIFLLSVYFFLPSGSQAQTKKNGRISGKVMDAATKQPLEGATVSALDNSSGSYINYSVSNKKGEFILKNIPLEEEVDIIVTYSGYKDTSAIFKLDATNRELKTGDWKLLTGAQELEEVVVKAHKAPFVIKKDTLEFNASSFKSLPNDMVKDLLRKLPGLFIDNEGNVTINGKKVDKILVDGKTFFGDNLKLATENLPSDIIDKVQVVESVKPGDENLSVIRPLNKEMTLNLTLKKDKKSGLFGNVEAGYGTSERYVAGGMVNAFNKEKRISVFGNAGNTPDGARMGGENFSRMEMAGMGGDMNNGAGGIPIRSLSGGLNFNNQLGKKVALSASYVSNSNRQSQFTKTDRTNILPDSTFLYNSQIRSTTNSGNHQLNSQFDYKIDSLQTLTITPSVSIGENDTEQFTEAISKQVSGALINRQSNRTNTPGRSLNISNRLGYALSSANRKTHLSVSWNLNANNGKGTQNNISANEFFNTAVPTTDSINQYGDTKNGSFSNNLNVQFSRKLSKSFQVLLNYNFTQNNNSYNRDIYNYNEATGKHDQLDSLYSNANRNTGTTHLPGLSVGYNKGKISAELGAGMRYINQNNELVWRDSTITINQKNFNPRASFAYKFSAVGQLVMNYSVNSSQPSAEQLSPITDISNPLYIRIGNPSLESSITHDANLQVNFFTKDYKMYSLFNMSGTITGNQIVDDTYYDSLGRQVSTYRNINGTRGLSVNVNVGTRIKLNEWSLDMGFAGAVRNDNRVSFVNRQENTANSLNLNPSIRLGMGYKSAFYVTMMAGVDLQRTGYSLPGLEDVNYNVKHLNVMFKANPVKRLTINGAVNYYNNSQIPEDFQRSRLLLNGSVYYAFLKSQRLFLGLAVNNILNNNNNLTRSVSPTAIDIVQVDALGSYALVTITYKLSNFGTQLPF